MRRKRGVIPRRQQVLKTCELQLSSVAADEAGEQALLLARKTRHVGVLEQVGAVAMIAAVRDIKAGLMQPRGPLQRKIRERILEPPRLAHLRQKLEHGRLHALGLREVDVIALLHRAHGALARIFIREPSEHVVEQPFAHRAFGDAHLSDPQHLKDFRENRGAAGKNRAPILGDCLSRQARAYDPRR